MTEGWKCPVCARGVAPSVKTCDHGGDGTAIAAPLIPPKPSWPARYIPMWQCRCGQWFYHGAYHACWMVAQPYTIQYTTTSGTQTFSTLNDLNAINANSNLQNQLGNLG